MPLSCIKKILRRDRAARDSRQTDDAKPKRRWAASHVFRTAPSTNGELRPAEPTPSTAAPSPSQPAASETPTPTSVSQPNTPDVIHTPNLPEQHGRQVDDEPELQPSTSGPTVQESPARDLWREAFEKLPKQIQEKLGEGESKQKPFRQHIDELLEITRTRQEKCEKNRWKFPVGD
ncbi:hypothetical protein QBC46DRAFT_359439, partial [Diplogelasinospora grovesii]